MRRLMRRPLLDSKESKTRPGGGRKAWRIARSVSAAGATMALLAFGCAAKLSSPSGVQSEAIPCVNAYDCPRAPNACMVSTCVERYCAMASASEKTVAAEQKAGDCALVVCDGRGGTMSLEDPQDWPADDGQECTEEACEEGKPVHTPLEVGAKCEEKGVCNGKGACGEC